MINHTNYYEKLWVIDVNKLPEILAKGHALVEKTTSHGKNWDNYFASETIKKVIDLYFAKLFKYGVDNKILIPDGPRENSPKTSDKKPSVENPVKVRKVKETKPAKTEPEETSVELTERIPEEIRIIKRFIKLHNQPKTSEEILRFINTLQKAILERRIRKTSDYAKQILYIQSHLIDTFKSMSKVAKIKISPEILEEYQVLVKSEKVFPSVNFIKGI